MANSYFRFKQFTVWHDKCAMKVGTDGVLLGAWSNLLNAEHILDVGTGTGLISLMIAQRSEAEIVALDIDHDAVLQAEGNVAQSAWKERIKVIQHDFKTYNPNVKFDVIVSNPPYFTDSLKCPKEQRAIARHNNSLSYQSLFEKVSQLLAENGRFCVIIPMDALDIVKRIAAEVKLHIQRQLNVVTTPGTLPKRVLLEFSFVISPNIQMESLLIEIERHVYSSEYIALTKEYYLKM